MPLRVRHLRSALALPVCLAACSGEAPRADRAALADTARSAGAVDAGPQPWDVLEADSLVRTTQHARTAQGELRVEEVRYREPGARTYRLRLEETLVIEAELSTDLTVRKVWDRPAFQPDASVALVEVSPGGKACGWLYRLATLRPDRPPAVTRELGTCSPPDSVWMDGNALRMRFPAWVATAMAREDIPPGPPSTWIYRGGRLEKEEP